MSVGIYLSANENAGLSSDSDFTRPFAITFDGRVGGYKETKLFIRNDDPLRYYTDLTLSLDDETARRVTTNTIDGFAWKLKVGDTKPTFNDWANTAAGNTVAISDIGAEGEPDTSTYIPFWVFIQVPEGIDVQVFTDVKFVVSGTENLV